ncbi:MAG: ATP-dependent dethiobiotin synthetase BioD, partial [Rickettsiales bacterium]
QREGNNISFCELINFCREQEKSDADILLVEGVGGVCVPLNDKYTVLDLMAELKDWKIILVTGSYLGSISHTLTAAHTLSASNIKLHAVIVNESENSTVSLAETVNTLKNFIKKPIDIITLPRKQASSLKRLCL